MEAVATRTGGQLSRFFAFFILSARARARARAPASTGYSGDSGRGRGRGREMDIADFGLLCGNDLVIYDRNGRVVS